MRYSPILLALLGSLATSHGYVLDSSCDPYRSKVIDVMKGAFDLAEKGRDALGDFASGHFPEDPKTQAHSDLVSWLFADVKAGGLDPNYQTAFNKFSSVLGYNTNQGQPETTPPDYKALSTDKVVIFCDYKRFDENKDCNGNPKKGYVCDTKMGVYWPMNDIYKDCKKHSIFSSSAVQAWTYEFASKGARKASEIQLCSDFLKELQKSNIKTLHDQGTESALARSWKKFSDFLDDPARTPIDVAYTFDATLLHEMTHAIPNAATADLDKGDCYGWNKCKKLAKAGTNNADTYAIFGLAAQMISQQGQRPMEDGSVKALPALPARRGLYRSLLSRADDPEGFLSSTGKPYSTLRTSTRASSGANGLPSSGQPGTGPVVAPTSGTAFPGGSSSNMPPATSPTRPASTSTPPDTSQSSNPASPGIPPATSISSGEPVSPSSSSSHAAGGTSTSDGGPASTSVTAGSSTDPASITSMPQGSSVSTVTSGSSTIPIPMTVIDVTNSGTTTPVTYISTKTSVDDGQPTAAWMCTGPLCNTGCKVPIFCDSPDVGSSWGLCCGFSPPALPDGTLPPPGGPPPPYDGGDETTPDDDSTSSTSESTTESSSETSSETSSESTTSSTTPTTYSSGITSSSTTSTSDEPVLTDGPIGDRFLAWDPAMPSWYQVQESVLSAFIADTTDPYITWTPSPTASADTSSSSKPPITSSTSLMPSPTSESTSSIPTETSSSSKPPIGSPSTPVSTLSTSTETSSSATEESTSSNPPTGSSSIPVTASSTDAETSSPSPATTPPPSTTDESPDPSGTTTIFADSNNEYGEALYYTSLSYSILDVYTLSMTLTTGAGDPTTLQTAMPSATSIDNDGSSQCHNLSKDMCVEAAEGFKNDAEDSDNPYELLTGRTDHHSSDKWVALFDYQCIAVLECEDDSPGMSGLQAYKALQDMFDQDETSVEKCGHSYLDNECVVRTDYHFNY